MCQVNNVEINHFHLQTKNCDDCFLAKLIQVRNIETFKISTCWVKLISFFANGSQLY